MIHNLGMSLVQHKQTILSLFKCQQSGQCCRVSGYVYVSEHEMREMAQILGVSLSLFKSQFVKTVNGWSLVASPTFRTQCFLNQNQQCDVYAARPEPCQSYPNWDSIWASDKTLMNEASQCAGLNKAITKFKSIN